MNPIGSLEFSSSQTVLQILNVLSWFLFLFHLFIFFFPFTLHVLCIYMIAPGFMFLGDSYGLGKTRALFAYPSWAFFLLFVLSCSCMLVFVLTYYIILYPIILISLAACLFCNKRQKGTDRCGWLKVERNWEEKEKSSIFNKKGKNNEDCSYLIGWWQARSLRTLSGHVGGNNRLAHLNMLQDFRANKEAPFISTWACKLYGF